MNFRCPISLCEATTGFLPTAFRIFSGSRSFTTLKFEMVLADFSRLVFFSCLGHSMLGLSYLVLLERRSPYSGLCSLLLLLLVAAGLL